MAECNDCSRSLNSTVDVEEGVGTPRISKLVSRERNYSVSQRVIKCDYSYSCI